MLKKSLLITAIIISAGFCTGDQPPGQGGGDVSTPEPVSTTMVGAALAVLISKKIRKN